MKKNDKEKHQKEKCIQDFDTNQLSKQMTKTSGSANISMMMKILNSPRQLVKDLILF